MFCVHYAYRVRNLKTYLRDSHSGSAATKKAVVQQYSHLTIAAPKDVKTPSSMGEPFAALGRPKRVYVCDELDCGYISVSRDAVRKHCYRHGWAWSPTTPQHWYEDWAQCFFPSSGFQRYFIVDYSEQQDEGPSESVDADRQAILDDFNAVLKQHEEEMDAVAAEVAKQDKTLWWKKTGWQEHLQESNPRHLSSASRLPDQDEVELQQVRTLAHELIESCVKGLRTLDNELRRWLRSAKRSEPDVRPLARLQNRESQDRYADYIVRLVCYSLRVWCSLEQTQGDVEEEARSEYEGSDSEEQVRPAAFDTMKDARRLFPWHGEQKDLAGGLWASLQDEGSDARQMQALRNFLQSLVCQTVRGDNFCSPVLHFLAVLGIDAEMGRLREANDFSFMLAGVVYCTRVIAVDAVLPSGERHVQGEEDDARFLEFRLKYLADGGFSPMSKMLSMLAYGKYIAFNHQNAGSLFWEGDNTVLFRGWRIALADFRSMVHSVISRAEELLWDELMWAPKAGRFTIALDDIVDDVSFTKRGFSFLDEPANGLQDTRSRMLDKMDAHPDGRKMRRGGQWQGRPVRKYLQAVDRFRELLLFCVHITGGQPGRGTEITAIRSKNGFLQDRNIFIIRGQVVVVTRYHKSASQLDKPKVIPRFLPWRVGQLMAVYLAYVQGMAQYLRSKTRGVGLSEHLWENDKGVWETDRLSRVLARQTQEHLGTKLMTLDYRHVAIFIGRKVVGEGFAKGFREEAEDVEEPEVEGDDDPLEMSAGRGGEIGANRYGVSMDVIKYLSDRTLQTFRPLSEGWHTFLELQSSGTSRKRRRGQSGEEEADPIIAQCGILRPIKQMRRAGAPSGLATPPPSSPQQDNSSRVTFSSGLLSDGVKMDVRRRVSEEEVRQAMAKVLGQDTVEFRSEHQRESLLSVANNTGQTPLVVVLPTGGGKSMLFMVPACLEDPGVTVVVVPFRALLDNLLAKARERGIDSIEWRSGATRRATLVFVSADNVAGTGFIGHLKQWEQKGVLRRVFLDEAHVAFKDNHWRAKLAGLHQLRGTRCPLVMLTATLPVTLESELEQCMAAQYARYIRCSTIRARTRYIVEEVKRGTLRERVLDLCRRIQAQLGQNRGVVYCKSRAECEELAKELGVMYFRGQEADNPERLEYWLRQNGLIVATSALGTGVDFERIVLTLHVDIPYGMVDYAQESGRGGRAGEDVDSLLICEQGAADRAYKRARNCDERAIANFVRTQGCRRKVKGLYLDGEEVSCGQGGLARCDNCGEGVTALERRYKRDARERSGFELTMYSLGDFCAACWGCDRSDSNGFDHSPKDCTAAHSLAEVEAFRGQLRFDKDTHSCYKCGISQRLCRTGQDSNEVCQWPGRMAPILYALVQREDRLHTLRDAGCNEDSSDVAACVQWLGRRHPRRIWNEVVSNGMAVLIRAIVGASTDEGSALSQAMSVAAGSPEVEELPSSPPLQEYTRQTGVEEVASEGEEEGDGFIDLLSDWTEPEESSAEHDELGFIGADIEEACQSELKGVGSSSDSGEESGEELWNGVEGSGKARSGASQQRGSSDLSYGELQCEEFEAQLRTWQNQCSICLVGGLDGRGHTWRECKHTKARERVASQRAWLGQVRYRYSACSRCHAPQAVCRMWQGQRSGGRWRFARAVGRQCQFKEVVLDVGTAIWVGRESEVRGWIAEQRGGSEALRGGEAGVLDWFGQQFVAGGFEVSGLCRVIWQFGPRGPVSDVAESSWKF